MRHAPANWPTTWSVVLITKHVPHTDWMLRQCFKMVSVFLFWHAIAQKCSMKFETLQFISDFNWCSMCSDSLFFSLFCSMPKGCSVSCTCGACAMPNTDRFKANHTARSSNGNRQRNASAATAVLIAHTTTSWKSRPKLGEQFTGQPIKGFKFKHSK